MSKHNIKFTVTEAAEYLENNGEWHTVRNVPRDVMIKWAEYLKSKEQHNPIEINEISDPAGCAPEITQG
jgi:hypothetical protein